MDLSHEYIYINGKEMWEGHWTLRTVGYTAWTESLCQSIVFAVSVSLLIHSRKQQFFIVSKVPLAAIRLCGHHLPPYGNHQLSGVTLRPAMSCTRPGYLCNVFQRRHYHLCFLSIRTTRETDFCSCFIIIAKAHRAILAPKYAQSKHSEREKNPSYFFSFTGNWLGLSSGTVNAFSKVILEAYGKSGN